MESDDLKSKEDKQEIVFISHISFFIFFFACLTSVISFGLFLNLFSGFGIQLLSTKGIVKWVLQQCLVQDLCINFSKV